MSKTPTTPGGSKPPETGAAVPARLPVEEPPAGNAAAATPEAPAGDVEIRVTEPAVVAIEKEKTTLFPEPGKKTEAELKAARVALDKMLIGLGALAAGVTGMEEMKFTEGERELLAEVWAPFLPNVPAITIAVMVTLPIMGGKVGIYLSKHPKAKKTALEAPKDPTADIPAKDLPEEIKNAG